LDATGIFGAALYWQDSAFVGANATFGPEQQRLTETILLQLARHNLPIIGGCLLLAGAVAIIFSTANTFLMVPSTNLARDIYQRFINPNVSQKGIILFQRAMIVLLSLVALVITTAFVSILDMALYAYTMVGAAVTPALLAAFLWKRVTPAGGVSSIAAGMVTTLLFGALHQSGMESLNLVLFRLPIDYDYIIYPAATASLVCLIVVSLLTPPSPEEKWKPFVSG
jgi:SSS family solute:Na+ symporter/sodium/proline symporter